MLLRGNWYLMRVNLQSNRHILQFVHMQVVAEVLSSLSSSIPIDLVAYISMHPSICTYCNSMLIELIDIAKEVRGHPRLIACWSRLSQQVVSLPTWLRGWQDDVLHQYHVVGRPCW
jgi:hypothetical protein